MTCWQVACCSGRVNRVAHRSCPQAQFLWVGLSGPRKTAVRLPGASVSRQPVLMPLRCPILSRRVVATLGFLAGIDGSTLLAHEIQLCRGERARSCQHYGRATGRRACRVFPPAAARTARCPEHGRSTLRAGAAREFDPSSRESAPVSGLRQVKRFLSRQPLLRWWIEQRYERYPNFRSSGVKIEGLRIVRSSGWHYILEFMEGVRRRSGSLRPRRASSWA